MKHRVHIPGMGAGVPLDPTPIVPVTEMPRRTEHKTDFHGCSVGLFVLLDEDNRCKGYRVRIIDPWTNHTYDLDIGQEVKEEWKKDLNSFPNVGEIAENAPTSGN